MVVDGAIPFVVHANNADFTSVGVLVWFVLGIVLGIPVVVLVVSQLLKKLRNGRARVKVALYS